MVKTGRRAASAAFFAVLALAGCGYTTKSLLPENIKNIHVAPVENAIDLSAEVSHEDTFRVYRPGVEIDVTNAIINRFIFDGNLKITGPEKADAIVEAKLVDYRRDPLRYTEGDDVQEYRLNVVIDCTVVQMPGRKVLWHEPNLTGDTSFFLSGPRAVSEDEAVTKAVEDLARRVVEKTVEIW
ncbi:MAG TPA: LPS assembly lipoprotein LptE [Candidatus Eisenbacteria bacterium]|jgi:hypothetical protein|nr:LPS assembly lipoprotein LptE [Candidatus Eisenbacteria bacterium]